MTQEPHRKQWRALPNFEALAKGLPATTWSKSHCAYKEYDAMMANLRRAREHAKAFTVLLRLSRRNGDCDADAEVDGAIWQCGVPRISMQQDPTFTAFKGCCVTLGLRVYLTGKLGEQIRCPFELLLFQTGVLLRRALRMGVHEEVLRRDHFAGNGASVEETWVHRPLSCTVCGVWRQSVVEEIAAVLPVRSLPERIACAADWTGQILSRALCVKGNVRSVAQCYHAGCVRDTVFTNAIQYP
jgi:hypothetical protein